MGNSYLLFKGKVSDTHLMIVKNELDRAEAAGNMPDLKPLTSQLKSPILGLIISILFGFIGFDRFYKGDGGAGVFEACVSSRHGKGVKNQSRRGRYRPCRLTFVVAGGYIFGIFRHKKGQFQKNLGLFLRLNLKG